MAKISGPYIALFWKYTSQTWTTTENFRRDGGKTERGAWFSMPPCVSHKTADYFELSIEYKGCEFEGVYFGTSLWIPGEKPMFVRARGKTSFKNVGIKYKSKRLGLKTDSRVKAPYVADGGMRFPFTLLEPLRLRGRL